MATGDDSSAAAVHIFNEDEDLLDDDDDDESSDHEEDESSVAVDRPPPMSMSMSMSMSMPAPPPQQVTIAVPGGVDLQLKKEAIAAASAVKKPAPPPDEARKLFQRLWTDEDEIELLRGFLEYTTQRCGPHNSSHPQHHHDTTAFYDQIKSKFQLDFNKNQLVEKLRRLKKKYRNVIGKFGSGKEYTFKSPHDQATFEISSKIWGNAVNGSSSSATAAAAVVYRAEEDDDDLNTPNFAIDCQSPNLNGIDVNSKIPRNRKRNRAGSVKLEEKTVPISTPTAAAVNSSINNTPPPTAAPAMTGSMSNVIEETVKSCLSPIFKELLNNSTMMSSINPNSNGPCCGHGLGLARSPIPLCFPGDKMANDRWRKQHILELEVYSKRLELVQDQIREQLEELRSMGN